MNEVYVLVINNEETYWNDRVNSIHKTYQGALKSKQAIEKNWHDNELDFSINEISIIKTELYD